MPQQEFRFSYLLTPQDYMRETIGVAVPLSFSPTADKDAYRFSYLPISIWAASVEKRYWLAEHWERRARRIELLLAEKEWQHASEKHVLVQAEQNGREVQMSELTGAELPVREGEMAALFEAARPLAEGNIAYLFTAQKPIIEGDKALLLDAEFRIPQKSGKFHELLIGEGPEWRLGALGSLQQGARLHPLEGDIQTGFTASEREIAQAKQQELLSATTENQKDAEKEELAQADPVKDEALVETSMVTAQEEPDAVRRVHRWIAAVQEPFWAKWINRWTFAGKEKQAARQEKRWTFAQKEKRSARRVQQYTFAVRDGKSAQRIYRWVYAAKEGKRSSRMARVIYALLEAQAASRIRQVILAHGIKERPKAVIEHPEILARFGTPEAVILRAMHRLEQHGLAADVFNAIWLDGKNERAARFVESWLFEGKAEKESETQRRIKQAVSSGIEAVRNLVLAPFDKKVERSSSWVERLIVALLNPGAARVVIEKLKNTEKIDRNAVIAILDEASIAKTPEGLIAQLKEGWNKDRENRPALLGGGKLAWWDVGFDELLETWEGLDYLDPPSSDYDYSQNRPLLYDENGVPYEPLSPINVPDVEVKAPITHPLPDWPDVGTQESWVDLFVFQDVVLNLVILMRKDSTRLAGMSGQKALHYVLTQLHDFLQEASPWDRQYQRMFRFVRWQAERIALKDSVTVLHRIYNDWTDGIVTKGQFDAPHTLEYMTIQPNGIIESISTSGYLEFTVENFIDGTVTFSTVISSLSPDSASFVEFYIDDVLVDTLYVSDSPARRSYDVPMGRHTYRLAYQAEVGDIVRYSGFVITGVHFKDAYTTQEDKGETRGLQAVNELVQTLLSYYVKHHQNKVKGAMSVKQRKIWLR